MKNFTLVPAILLALTGAVALSQDLPSTLPSRNRQSYRADPTLGYRFHFHIEGKPYSAGISRDEIMAGPDWKPSMPLPLTFARVEEIARAELKKIVGDTSAWEISELQLKRFPGKAQPKWFYVIIMAPGNDFQPKPDTFYAVMSLSGGVGKIEEDTDGK